jgi:cation transport regulator
MLLSQSALLLTPEARLPYADNSQLPSSVQSHLPAHAQDIYREAFNHSWEQYGRDEVAAVRVAWAAVKRRYEKRQGLWVPKAPSRNASPSRS